MTLPTHTPATAARRRRAAARRGAAALALGALAARPAGGAPPAAGPGFTVVVHATNPSAALPREQVARLFLRKLRRWPGGATAEPVDLAPGAPARHAFTRAVLGKSVATVRAYWQQRIFSGAEVPPPEKVDDADALAYVRTHPAAVAYVSDDAPLPGGVRPLAVTE
jgi:ABC-type phosphate transport system substrate-binding protein